MPEHTTEPVDVKQLHYDTRGEGPNRRGNDGTHPVFVQVTQS